MASRVCLEIKAHLENLENQATKVFLESWVLWVRSDQGERGESLVKEENWVQLVFRDLRASLVHQVQTGQRAVLDPRELLVTRVLQAYRGCQEREAILDLQVPKETEELWVRKDPKVQLEMTAQEELLVQLDQQDLQGPVVKRENQDLKDHQDLPDPEGCLEREETLVRSALLDLLDPLALMVSLE